VSPGGAKSSQATSPTTVSQHPETWTSSVPATMAPTLQVPVQLASVAEAATFTYQLPGAVPAGTFTTTCTVADWPLVSPN
jgi:hypothetical protein